VTDERPGPDDLDLPDVSRRRFLAGVGGSAVGVGAFRAVDNVFLGYGELGNGTNLVAQDLAAVVTENLALAYDERVAGTRIRLADGAVVVGTGDGERRLALEDDARSAAGNLDAELGLGGRLEALYADASDFSAGALTFSQPPAFFERVEDGERRPELVAALRGDAKESVSPELIRRFAGVDPHRTEALADGLVEGFREHASYDVQRYVAGSIEDNVIFGAADLRQHFEGDVSFEAMLSNEETGLFCWELVVRSMEALEAVEPWAQRPPVATCYVSDDRHKHAFTGVASAVRVEGDLVVPMTFLDYTHSTLYDDFHLTSVTGRGLAAYDDRHRATDVYW
jgi:hypothetical protein